MSSLTVPLNFGKELLHRAIASYSEKLEGFETEAE